MASNRAIVRLGNLVKYRRHVLAGYTIGLIVSLTTTRIVLYTDNNVCIDIPRDFEGNMQLVSRPYSRVL